MITSLLEATKIDKMHEKITFRRRRNVQVFVVASIEIIYVIMSNENISPKSLFTSIYVPTYVKSAVKTII